MIYIGGEEIQNIYVGDSEISAIYAGEELIYPVNLGTLIGISFEDLTWESDVPASGGVATEGNCSYKVLAHYDSGKNRNVTKDATITGSLVVQETTAETREMVGVLQLTATYEGFTATGSVDAYQQSVGPIPSGYKEIQYIYNTDIAYIPTDIYFTSDMWFQYKVRITGSWGTPERHIFSGYLFDNSQIQHTYNTWFIRGDRTISQRVNISSAYAINQDAEVVLYRGNNNIVINGVNRGSLTAKGTTDTHKAYFFSYQETATSTSSGSNLGMIGYLYYYKVGSNTTGEEIYNFVPVRRISDGMVGLYETINGVFYEPRNSSYLLAGPDVE